MNFTYQGNERRIEFETESGWVKTCESNTSVSSHSGSIVVVDLVGPGCQRFTNLIVIKKGCKILRAHGIEL